VVGLKKPSGDCGKLDRMILEHAVLSVKEGQTAAFETAFDKAKHIIAESPGFRRLTLSRCHERTCDYLLLVEWDSLEDHTEGFRRSDAYASWKALLHHFYEPFPAVDHFAVVAEI
jgi:heme-degrading monooxygenase HmoA